MYRRRFSQPNTRSKTLDEIYPTYILAHLSNRKEMFWTKSWALRTLQRSAFLPMVFLVLEFDSKTVQRRALCRSRRALSNEYLLAEIGVDTAENEPLEVWRKLFNIIYNFIFFSSIVDNSLAIVSKTKCRPRPVSAAALRLSDTETLKVEHFWQRPCDCQTKL